MFLKHWPNVDASLRKLKTWVNLRLRLARACVHLRWLAMPWLNGVASRRKLKTWVYLWLRLARPCVHLRWLAMTCAHFGLDQINTQVKASFSPFGHPTQVSTQVQLASTCDYLAVRLPRASLSSGRDQICTQVDASFSPFGHQTQVNASWATSINLLLVNKIEDSLS